MINLKKDISIIIVNWNTRDLLISCLNSVNSNNSTVECIVVDNASNDGSVEAVRATHPNVRIIQNDFNLGFAKANNIGIKYSIGDYVCLVNSDVEILPGCIDRMVDYMSKNEEIGILAPKLLNYDGTLQVSCKKFPTLWNNFCDAVGMHKLFGYNNINSGTEMNYMDFESIQVVEVAVGAFLMIRRRALNAVGLLDENFFFYGEDIDLCKRFFNAGWKVVFYPKAEVIHYGGASSSKQLGRFRKELFNAKLKYWEKHRSRIATVAYIFIALLNRSIRLFQGLATYILPKSKKREIAQTVKYNLDSIKWLIHTLNPFKKTKY